MDREQVRALTRARRRVAEAMPYSPEWRAAIEGLEELERGILEATSLAVHSQASGTTVHHIHLEVDGRELASIVDHHLGAQMPLAGTSVLRPMGG